jgi:dipeptidyl aminopeptidase/acylaminoacyl peptidase
MTIDPENFARIEAAGPATFSRDGATLFHLRGAGLAQIWAMDLASGAARQLTHHDEKVAMLRRAPKDDRIIYGIDAGGDERQQLWLLDGDTSTPLTAAPQVIHDFGAWSPDGTQIAYAANDADEGRFDVVLRQLGSPEIRRLLEGRGILTVAGWRPDGQELIVILDRASPDQTILLLDPATGATREVPRAAMARFSAVRWAEEGTALHALTDAGGRDFIALCRIDPQTGGGSPIYEAPGREIESYALSPDGKTLATVENDRGWSVLRVGPLGGERPAVTGLPHGVVADLSFSVDSTKLAFTAASPVTPAGLWLWQDGAAKPLWQPTPEAADVPSAALRDFALVEWTSFDGRTIPGWYATPAGAPPAAGWPAVIWVHGGPAGQTRPNFRADMQMLLARGYAVMMPNVRGSTGYGRAALLSDERERRLDTVADLAHGRHWLAARPEIDANRIGVMGQSYGGYMVNAAITEYPELWRAAVNYYGIADFTTLLAKTGPWRRSHRADEYGHPEEHAELFARISPIRNVDRVTTPLLLLHGDRDPRVPFDESVQMEEALRIRQKRVEFERFDYAGHGFIRPDHKRRVYVSVAAFFDRHLVP